MLELGKAGTAGAGTGVIPVLLDDAVVATLRASDQKESATDVLAAATGAAVIGGSS